MTIPAGTLVPRDARDFGSYELLAKLATGGMAEIFLARPHGHAHSQLLVLKRILPHLAEDDHFVTMFRDEADLASKLIHPNVCRVHTLGHHSGSWFIAMEYLHGVPLSRMMTRLSKQGKQLDIRIVAGIIVAACEGLHHAHELKDASGQLQNVVHRDVSPPNIMIVKAGLVKLLDFGIAKAASTNAKTRTGTVKGKNAYMSPEQIMGKALDRRSDIFALGTVMYELLTIKRLFHRDSDFMTFKAISEEPIPDISERRPDLPMGLKSVLMQALARDPNGRFSTAKQFGDAIRGATMSLGGPASTSEIAEFLMDAFGDELALQDEILRASDDPSQVPATSPQTGRASTVQVPGMAASDDGKGSARAGSIGGPVSGAGGARMLASATPSTGVPASTSAIPSEVAFSTPHRAATPFPMSQGTGPTGVPASGPVLARAASPALGSYATGGNVIVAANASGSLPRIGSAIPTPMAHADTPPIATRGDATFTGLTTDPVMLPITDDGSAIFKASRQKAMRNMVIAGVVICAGAVAAFVATSGSSGSKAPAQAPAVIAPAVDAAPAVTPKVDAPPKNGELSRDDIIAISRFGFISMTSEVKATLYINDKLVGDLPLKRHPYPPGEYKAKLVGGNGKTKRFALTIYGGKDTDIGAINWAAK